MDVQKKNPMLATLPVTEPPPAKTEKKGEAKPKPSIDFTSTTAPPSPATMKSVAGYFDAQTKAKPLNGPGVSTGVFGPVSPDIKHMSDAALATNLVGLAAAMRANVGKTNDYDFALLEAMKKEAATRMDAKLQEATPPEKLGNRELLTVLVGYDVKKASGAKLSATELARYAKAEQVLQERTTKKSIEVPKELVEKRAELVHAIERHCAGAAMGAVGIADPTHVVSALAAATVIYSAAKDGHPGEVLREGATFLLSVTLKGTAGKVVEVASVGIAALECLHDAHQLSKVEKEIARYTN